MKAFRIDLARTPGCRGPRSRRLQDLLRDLADGRRDEAEAEERCGAARRSREAAPAMTLAQMASLTDIDFASSTRCADRRAHHQRPAGHAQALPRAQGSTLREIAQQLPLRLRGPGRHARDGRGADGRDDAGGRRRRFRLPAGLTRRYVAEITDGLVPALQRWGWCAPPTSTSISATICSPSDAAARQDDPSPPALGFPGGVRRRHA